VLTKVLTQEPFELDFDFIYCFDCARQLFYRVTALRAQEEISQPVLRFKCAPALLVRVAVACCSPPNSCLRPREKVFIIDDADAMPPPHWVVDERAAQEMGLDVSLDEELDQAVAQLRAELDGDASAEAPESSTEEEEALFDNSDDMRMANEDPDVPAVDMA